MKDSKPSNPKMASGTSRRASYSRAPTATNKEAIEQLRRWLTRLVIGALVRMILLATLTFTLYRFLGDAAATKVIGFALLAYVTFIFIWKPEVAWGRRLAARSPNKTPTDRVISGLLTAWILYVLMWLASILYPVTFVLAFTDTTHFKPTLVILTGTVLIVSYFYREFVSTDIKSHLRYLDGSSLNLTFALIWKVKAKEQNAVRQLHKLEPHAHAHITSWNLRYRTAASAFTHLSELAPTLQESLRREFKGGDSLFVKLTHYHHNPPTPKPQAPAPRDDITLLGH